MANENFKTLKSRTILAKFYGLAALEKDGSLLIFDTIPDPAETDCPEVFLRNALRLARTGPGLVMFGDDSWNQVQAVRNRVDAHFILSKTGDAISFEDFQKNVCFSLHLPRRAQKVMTVVLKCAEPPSDLGPPCLNGGPNMRDFIGGSIEAFGRGPIPKLVKACLESKKKPVVMSSFSCVTPRDGAAGHR